MMQPPRARTLLAFALLLAGATQQAKGPAPTEKGTYKDWNDDLIDRLEVVEPFRLADYARLAVLPLDTSSTPLPESDDNTYAPTTEVLGNITGIFAEGLRKGLGGRLEVVVTQVPPEGESAGGTLVLRGKVTEMNPGSRAARFWVGFGAGKSRVEVECQVADASSGKVHLEVRHARASGVGVTGGEYAKFLTDDGRDVGEDIGKMFLAF